MTHQSIEPLIDGLYGAEEGDKLKVDIDDAPTHICTIEENASLPRKQDGEGDTAEYSGNIYLMVSVDYDESPVPNPEDIGPIRAITAQRSTTDGTFNRPKFDIMVPAISPPGDNQKWVEDPRDIESIEWLSDE